MTTVLAELCIRYKTSNIIGLHNFRRN
jgi:hypothetical protein